MILAGSVSCRLGFGSWRAYSCILLQLVVAFHKSSLDLYIGSFLQGAFDIRRARKSILWIKSLILSNPLRCETLWYDSRSWQIRIGFIWLIQAGLIQVVLIVCQIIKRLRSIQVGTYRWEVSWLRRLNPISPIPHPLLSKYRVPHIIHIHGRRLLLISIAINNAEEIILKLNIIFNSFISTLFSELFHVLHQNILSYIYLAVLHR